jgi:transposase
MALGSAKVQQRFDNPREILGDRLREGSIYRLLADHGHSMFGDDYFADCYTDSAKGRPTMPARVMATVMVLQAFEGLSDREACDRLEVDLRWQAACGVDTGAEAFHPTALVGQRNRLRASSRPRRLFEDTKVVATETGAMKNRARVPRLDPHLRRGGHRGHRHPAAGCHPQGAVRTGPGGEPSGRNGPDSTGS